MNKKALIIFAKEPVPGNVKTRLIPALSPDKAAQLYLHMLTDTMKKVESLQEVDRFLFYDGGMETEEYFRRLFPALHLCQQERCDLGVRMEAAFTKVFAKGYRTAAIIGTDSPDLPLSFIFDAFNILEKEEADIVFGPAEDGGYYLLGMRRLHGELFHGIRWSTGQVLRESLKKAELAGLVAAALPVWCDVDTIEDLKRLKLRNGENGAPLTGDFIREIEFLT
jgi:rSAM/selenodomain-associated transferase 1